MQCLIDLRGSVSGIRLVGMVFKVADLFDHDPEAALQINTGLDVNPSLGRHDRSHLAPGHPCPV